MNVKRAAKLMQIASYYGEEKQVCKLMEELGEATSAASEVLMLLSYHEQGGKKRDLTARLEHLARGTWPMLSMSLSRLFSCLDWKLILRWRGTREFRKHLSGFGRK